MDALFYGLHKAQQFLGMEALPTFCSYDIISTPNFETDSKRLNQHLAEIFA